MTGFSVGINILVCDFNTMGEETASLEKKSLSLSKKHVPFILSTEFCGAVIWHCFLDEKLGLGWVVSVSKAHHQAVVGATAKGRESYDAWGPLLEHPTCQRANRPQHHTFGVFEIHMRWFLFLNTCKMKTRHKGVPWQGYLRILGHFLNIPCEDLWSVV